MAYAFNDDKSKFDLDTLAGNMATIETSPTVNNHGTGEYILYDNVLYKVISPIAAGESLVLGTNVRSINIGNQLKALQDSMVRKPDNIGDASVAQYIGTYIELYVDGPLGRYSLLANENGLSLYDSVNSQYIFKNH